MNRREFLRAAAAAAVALGLAQLPNPTKHQALWDTPIKYAKGRDTIFTDWIECTEYDKLWLSLPPLDWTIRTIYTEEEPELSTIDLAALNAGDWLGHEWYDERVGAWRPIATLAKMLRERADLEEEA